MTTPNVRPLKVIVQVVTVVEQNDGSLLEVATDPAAIPAKDWADVAGGLLATAVEAVKNATAPQHNGRVTAKRAKA